MTPVSLVEQAPAPPSLEEPAEAPAEAVTATPEPARPCPITLTLDVQAPADDLETLLAEAPALSTPEVAPISAEPPEWQWQPEPVAAPQPEPSQARPTAQGDVREGAWTAGPQPAPTMTGEVLDADPCAAEFVMFPNDPRRQAALFPMRDVESMMFEEMMRRAAQPRPKASSSWVLLAAGAGIGAGATALLSMLTLPVLIGALRGPPPQAAAASPAAAQPSTVILSGFVPAAASAGAARAEAGPAATTGVARPARIYRDPPPGSLPVVEEWGRGRPLPPELAQALVSPSRAGSSPAAEPRDRQPAKDADPAAGRR